MVEITDTELLEQLRDVMVVPSVTPDEATMSRLYATLAELDDEPAPVVAVPNAARSARGARRRRLSTRGSLLAAAASTLFLTAGVATAAVVTNTLPGVTRNVAYDLGLPVTSPALVHTQYAVGQLRDAIAQGSPPSEKLWGNAVLSDLKTLNASDLKQIGATADNLLTEVGLASPTIIGGPNPTTDTPGTTPSVSVPTVTVPSVTIPIASVPSVSVPSVTVPPITVPSVTVPSVTIPSVSVPSVTLPTITIPPLKRLL